MSVLAAGGFEAFGLASGIKESGAPDLALLATADRTAVSAAGVFTTNLATAAPVLVSRAHLVDGRAAAVIVNSGNANAATGQAGRRNALRMCELSARELGCAPDDVLVCSTGLIGIPMPMAPIETSVGRLAAGLTAGPEGATAAATAMLTTDTVRRASPRPGWAGRSRSRWAAWPRAPRCSNRRWPRCSRSSPPTSPSIHAR
jgi:glutamate N-acetyltransferase/amino-acid N-acetyltransferase